MIKINLVPPELLDKEAKKQMGLYLIAAGLGVGLVFFVFSFLMWRRGKAYAGRADEMERELKKYEEIVRQVEELEKNRAVLDAKLNVMRGLTGGRLLYPKLMEDFAKHLARGVWVLALAATPEGSGLKLNMTATSLSQESISDWIRSMEGSGKFVNVELGAVSRGGTGANVTFGFTVNCSYKGS